MLRRAGRTPQGSALIEVGPLAIDRRTHAVSLHGCSVTLRRLEFELLAHLAQEPERVFAKRELLDEVWGYLASGSTRTVDSHASRLRRKLAAVAQERWVVNVWGIGYRLM